MMANEREKKIRVCGEEYNAGHPKLKKDVLSLELEQISPHQPVKLRSNPHENTRKAFPPEFYVAPW